MYYSSMLSKTDYIAKHGEKAWETEKVKRSAYQKEYYCKNKETKTAKQKKYRKTDQYKEWRRDYDKDRRNTMKGRAHSLLCAYKETDKQRDLGPCTITEEWIMENIFNSTCVYCGDSNWKNLGVDRIDNEKAHTPENSVCACVVCNAERANRFSVSEFVEYRKNHPNIKAN